MSTDTPPVETRADHPDDGSGEPYTCGYCGRPFAREEWLTLHRGVDHEGAMSDAEREAFRAAYEAEEEDIRMFRLQAIGVLVLIYFLFLIVYGLVT